MPELPEVEQVRRSLTPALTGRTVVAVHVRRAEVVRGGRDGRDLLKGTPVASLRRHGKQLAIVGQHGKPVVCVHLGMSGRLNLLSPASENGQGDVDAHTHVQWEMEDGSRLVFRDPRRFGGIWTFDNEPELQRRRWARLGPDALSIKPGDLWRRLRGTRRAIKTALLDQRLLAGLGNIYVDELLYACRLNPARPAETFTLAETQAMVRRMRRLLERAIHSGGSSFRDYVDANGQKGGFQKLHQVYGRGGEPCVRCGSLLLSAVWAGRTSVYCASCQK